MMAFSSLTGNTPNPTKISDLNLLEGKAGLDTSKPAAIKPKIDFLAMPLYFIANQGQVDAQAAFYAKASRYTLWLTREGLVFDSVKNSKRDVTRMQFLKANKTPQMVSINESKLEVNYFKGSDKSKWLGGIPTSMAVLYKDLYKKVDLKVYGIEKQIEYDWIVKAGGNPTDIAFTYSNVRGARLDKEGNLLIAGELGEMIHARPVSYQVIDGKKTPVTASFKKIAKNTYGFEVGAYDNNHDLVIDPVVWAYSTFLYGADEYDGLYDMVVDNNGFIYVTGDTRSTDFPITSEAYQMIKNARYDVFITKLDPSQSGADSLLYSTYIGGANSEAGFGITLDSNGYVYVTGETGSTDFPTVNAFQPAFGGSYYDSFILKLDLSKSGAAGLLYSTYVGGAKGDKGKSIFVDNEGLVYLGGNTYSENFPTVNPCQATLAGANNNDFYVMKLDLSQSGPAAILYSTFLGGGVNDELSSIAVDGNGYIYGAGYAASGNFPTKNAFQSVFGGGYQDVVVFAIDPTQSGADSLLYSTFLGGAANESGTAIVVGGNGHMYITGFTRSANFPTMNPYQGTLYGYNDSFVAELDPSLSGAPSLLYSTYLGVPGNESNFTCGIALYGNGKICVAGTKVLPGYLNDIFITKIDPIQSGADQILSYTLLGGTATDWCGSFAMDNSGNIYITGGSDSTDFPMVNAYLSTPRGYGDDGTPLIAKLSITPPVSIPTVDTPASGNVTYTTALLGGNVSATGGANVTERGIYWSTANGFTPPGQGTKVSETGNWGTGTFDVNVTGLPVGTLIYFQAFAINSSGAAYSAEASFTTIPISAATVTTTTVTAITTNTATSGGNVASDGGADVTARGVCWSTSAHPTTLDNKTVDGNGLGSFTSVITGLTPGTTYYARAYAINSVGTNYGSILAFTTAALTAPTLTTTAVTAITTITAASGGNVASAGGLEITARGVCWRTSSNPTISDNKTTDGAGIGSFTSSITGLTPGTTYFARAYATNSIGTSYGNAYSFQTLPNQAPAANPGPGQTVRPGISVTLDGSSSYDIDEHYPLTYAWTIAQKPAGSSATLTTPDQVTTSINIDTVGEFRIQLIVTDSFNLASAPVVAVISTVNSAPIAAAGNDKEITNLNVPVALDGSQSWDPDGDAITYLWTLAQKPTGSTATITNPTTETPSIVPDKYGDYKIQLVVSDPWVSSIADEVMVSSKNLAPVADAGDNKSGLVGATYTFNGSASTDPNGDALTYSWQIVSKPVGSTAVLSGAASVSVSIAPDLPGDYVIGLIVNDGLLDSPSDTASVMAISFQDALTQKLNQVIQTINSIPDSAFQNIQNKDNLTRKVSAILELVVDNQYQPSYVQLENSVLQKLDGCAKTGTPDKNDWIIPCVYQNQVYPLVNEALALLDNLF